MQIDEKIAVVTGASAGLGEAISRKLVANGALVYGLARNINSLNKIKDDIGEKFIPVALDISHQLAVNDWAINKFDKNHKPDILINNAGVGVFGNIDELPSDKWKAMIDTNLNGMYYITSVLVPFMKISDTSTHIVNIGSILGNTGYAGGSAYCTTKYGVQGFSDALTLELRKYNIKVTCVNPGSIETSFFNDSGIVPHHNMLQCNDIANSIIHVLSTPDNMLISEMTIRPLNPKKP